jgi:hypothetical protein
MLELTLPVMLYEILIVEVWIFWWLEMSDGEVTGRKYYRSRTALYRLQFALQTTAAGSLTKDRGESTPFDHLQPAERSERR